MTQCLECNRECPAGVLHLACEAAYLAFLREKQARYGDIPAEVPATTIERVATPDLKPGELVITYGMQIRIPAEPRTRWRDRSTIYAWDGQIENLAEVLLADVVPTSFLRESVLVDGEGWVWAIGTKWVIQGNELARWNVERPAPTQPVLQPSAKALVEALVEAEILAG